ncbi:MAG: phage holin family protein [Candidatus Melainabacteria bacterium]|jgi:putative membrane protein|nr:phage holin family protein [Candidatus Melainabacteria bacterium]
MMNFLMYWVMSSFILWIVALLVLGMQIDNIFAALAGSLVISVVNMLVKPFVSFLSLPITFLSLGLFSFVINAAMLGLAAWLVPGFQVHGFWAALLGSLLLSLLTGLFNSRPNAPLTH